MKLANGEYIVFIFPQQVERFEKCEVVIASTIFTDGDVPVFVTSNEYGKESHDGKLVKIKKKGWW